MSFNKRNTCPDFAEILRGTSADKQILEQVVHCFYEQLKVFAQWKCKSVHAAQDTLQDTMLNLMTSLDSYRGDAPLEAWLKKLVVSSCSRMQRGMKNNPNIHIPFEEEQTEGFDSEQEMRMIISEQSDKLLQLLESIDEPNRSLILLHEGQEQTLDELAIRFDLTVDAVKSRLKRTRQKIREALAENQVQTA